MLHGKSSLHEVRINLFNESDTKSMTDTTDSNTDQRGLIILASARNQNHREDKQC